MRLHYIIDNESAFTVWKTVHCQRSLSALRPYSDDSEETELASFTKHCEYGKDVINVHCSINNSKKDC